MLVGKRVVKDLRTPLPGPLRPARPGEAVRLLPSVLPYSPGQDRGRDFRLFIRMEEVGEFCGKGAFRVG